MSGHKQVSAEPGPQDRAANETSSEPGTPGAHSGGSADLDRSLTAVRDYLLSLQEGDGHWCAELEGDTILETEYYLLLYFLGERGGRLRRLANYVRWQQGEHGGWAIYPGGPLEVSASVKAYFVLKLEGDDPEAPHMARARRAIVESGGLDACNSFTKLYLAIFGQYPWSQAPAVPPELILLPRWFYFNIYEMSSWSRAIVVPLSMIWALKPSCRIPTEMGIEELYSGVQPERRYASLRARVFAGLFRTVDRWFKVAEGLGLSQVVRRRALARCEEWVLARLHKSGGLAAIFPSIMNTIVGLRCYGYGEDHPVIRQQLRELEKLEISDGDTLRLQPCFSPVWDTSLAMNSLLEAGLPDAHPALQAGARWLLDREVKEAGDWKVKNPDGPVGGWYFEYANEFYPDCDDTAEILALLGRMAMLDPELEERRQGAVGRALAWQLSMQNRDGGWGAFDRDCNKEVLTLVPFADHNAMIDPSTADVTARSVEALRLHGYAVEHPAVCEAVEFLHREQEEDGAWYGRWGANYIYGTWLALTALCAVGERAVGEQASPSSRRGVDWLLSRQNEDGGWGESLRSYDDPSLKGCGESTASQTAWAMLGVLAATDGEDGRALDAVQSGAAYLLRTQLDDGSWYDEQWTGTGFPSVFYLRYHLYSCYFPLQALATLRRVLAERARVGRAA